MPTASSTDFTIAAGRDLTAALQHPSPVLPLSLIGDSPVVALKQLASIFTTVADTAPTPPQAPTPTIPPGSPALRRVTTTPTVPPGFPALSRAAQPLPGQAPVPVKVIPACIINQNTISRRSSTTDMFSSRSAEACTDFLRLASQTTISSSNISPNTVTYR
jgi:hypothetical protein